MNAIGVDLGGTNLRVALVEPSGKIVRAVREPLVDSSPQACLELLERLIGVLAPSDPCSPVGIGLAGQVLVAPGEVEIAPNLGWRNVPFAEMIRRRLGRPVRLVNDLNAIAMGEAVAGEGRESGHLVCVFVGTGVGMGAVVAGELLEGARGVATELGHIKIESPETGRLCGCGERGCLEAYTAGRHLPALLHALRQGTADAVAEAPPEATATSIEAAAARGDTAARELLHQVGERLAMAIGNVVTLFNPEVLVLGGGVLLGAPSLRRHVAHRLVNIAGRPQQLGLQVRDTVLGDDAGIIGAGVLAFQKL